jgi:hypothetical protein
LTEHYSLVLGIVILVFALGLRTGLLGLVADLWAKRAATVPRNAQTPVQGQTEQR